MQSEEELLHSDLIQIMLHEASNDNQLILYASEDEDDPDD